MRKQNSNVLAEITRKFSDFRKLSPGQRKMIPEGLRKLALSARKEGYAYGRISQAAGLSRQAIVNWEKVSRARTKTRSVDGVVELKMIEGDRRAESAGFPVASKSEANAALPPLMRIKLRSGVTVEFPVSSLETRWLLELNGAVL